MFFKPDALRQLYALLNRIHAHYSILGMDLIGSTIHRSYLHTHHHRRTQTFTHAAINTPLSLPTSNAIIPTTITTTNTATSNWKLQFVKKVMSSIAILATAASPALCEAPPSFNNNTNSNNSNETISDQDQVRQAILDMWSRVQLQLDRWDAAQPQGQTLAHIPPPEITFIPSDNKSEGSGSQAVVEVIFTVPQSLNITGATAELRRLLSSTSSFGFGTGSEGAASTSETSTSGPKGVARRLRRSDTSTATTTAAAMVTVDVLEPYNPQEPARFEFRGPCTTDNLTVLDAVMMKAAQPRMEEDRRKQLRGQRGGGHHRFGGSIGDEELEAGLEQFFEPLRDLVEEFERMHAGMLHGGWSRRWEGRGGGGGSGEEDDNEDSGRDTLPTPFPPHPSVPRPRLPKRFDMDNGGTTHSYPSQSSSQAAVVDAAARKLRSLGCQVFLPSTKKEETLETTTATATTTTAVDWGTLAGYEEQKRAIEDCLLLPLVRPEVYDNVAKGTREKFAPNRPRAVLFVGPPGTGKTSSARVISSQAAVPLVYIPLESIVSKWFGEAEKNLAAALEASDAFPDGCIVFLDELDALATTRSGEMHEATRRLLGVLLRHMDGFDSKKRSVVVGATNRPQDLDPALLSRFSATVEFGLPGEVCRKEILRQYAHHLKPAEVGVLAAATPGMAGRDLRDVCEQAERRWAAKIIRGQAVEGELPPLGEYLAAADGRLKEMGSGGGGGGGREKGLRMLLK